MGHLIDHLWQSALTVALVWSLSRLTSANSAAMRLWMWRLAALKFALPFSLLYLLGGWIGFPVRHSAIPPPAGLQAAVDSVASWGAPMSVLSVSGPALWGSALLAGGLALLCAWTIAHELRVTTRERAEERAREEADAWHLPPPLGMFKATALAAAAICGLCAPMLAGALHDRTQRQAALAIDIEGLREAAITVTEADWRFGDRPEIIATAGGVSIRSINLQDLVAMVYGIDQFEVFGGSLPWLESPHYDVQASGPVHSPRVFDPYSLRQPVTKYLHDRYGVSIRVNGDCQEPCLEQESFVIERIPWALSKMITGQK